MSAGRYALIVVLVHKGRKQMTAFDDVELHVDLDDYVDFDNATLNHPLVKMQRGFSARNQNGQ